MPKPGARKVSDAASAMASAVYSPLASRVVARGGEHFALHVGDTFMEPADCAQMQALATDAHPGLHRYGPTAGLPALRAAVCEARGVPDERLLVVAGATSGLGCVISALANPGEEVLLLAPYWPLARGITLSARATPVEVPFYDRALTPEDALRALEEKRSERSVALYFSTPSNPTGRVLGAEMLEALADFARRHDLWLLSDEVYEAFVYRDAHRSVADFAPERTFRFHSFSKTYGMAGNRVGFVVTPEVSTGDAAALCEQVHKMSVHSAYHAPSAAQWAALRVLVGGAEWVARARAQYAQTGAEVAAALGVPAPEGGCFLFVCASDALRARGKKDGDVHALLEEFAEDGVLVAPGASAGADYADWFRLCFTAVAPERALAAARLMAARLS